MGLTENERAELHAIVSNVRDDRLRALVFKLLEETAPDWRQKQIDAGDEGRSGRGRR